ncbi:MAG: hypothetical protein QOD81_4 [Solirubrobacteraceae bacterium]|nr:hypothetical protein [Solirubrobacteraceae bacterium]
MLIDATVVNIALPSAQKALHVSSADRQWIVAGYLAFGGLLLLGGRIGDLFGRKPMLSSPHFVKGRPSDRTTPSSRPWSARLEGVRALLGEGAS